MTERIEEIEVPIQTFPMGGLVMRTYVLRHSYMIDSDSALRTS